MHNGKKALLYGNTMVVTTRLIVMTANTIVVSRNTVSNCNFEFTNGFPLVWSFVYKPNDHLKPHH